MTELQKDLDRIMLDVKEVKDTVSKLMTLISEGRDCEQKCCREKSRRKSIDAIILELKALQTEERD